MPKKTVPAKAEPKIPRQVKSRMVKDSILDAATELIKTNGYEYVTVNNVCSLAGVSVGSFYHHFENKDELLAYYLTAAFEKHATEYDEMHGDDVVANVLNCYSLYADFIIDQGVEFTKNYYTTKNKSLGRTQFNTVSRKKVSLPILEKTIELLADGVKNGYLLPLTNSEELGEDLCTIEKGTIFDWAICDGAYNLVTATHRLLKSHLRAYVTEKYLEQFPETYA